MQGSINAVNFNPATFISKALTAISPIVFRFNFRRQTAQPPPAIYLCSGFGDVLASSVVLPSLVSAQHKAGPQTILTTGFVDNTTTTPAALEVGIYHNYNCR